MAQPDSGRTRTVRPIVIGGPAGVESAAAVTYPPITTITSTPITASSGQTLCLEVGGRTSTGVGSTVGGVSDI